MPQGSYNTVTVTTSPTLIMAANSERKGLIIFNNGSATVYIGPDASITTSNAIPILSNASFNNSGTSDSFRGSVYGIVASASVDCRCWEWVQ